MIINSVSSRVPSSPVYGIIKDLQKKGDPKIVGVDVIPSGEVNAEGFQNVTVWIKATGLDPDTYYFVLIGTHLFGAKDSMFHGNWVPQHDYEYVNILKKPTAMYGKSVNIVTPTGKQLMDGVSLSGKFKPESKNGYDSCYDGYITIGKSPEYSDEMAGKAVVSGGYKIP